MSIDIKNNISLSRYTTFKIGGAAKFFCEVRNEQELEEAINYAKNNKIAAFIMGGGANILVSDQGFDGLVIRITSQSENGQPKVKMKMENGNFFIECWAGESLSSIVKLASDSSMTGLEWAAGIPGSIGGAIRGNAGAFGMCMGDIAENIKALDLSESVIIVEDKNQNANIKNQNYKSKFKIFNNAGCEFSYRDSIFKQKDNLVIMSAVLKLGKGNKNEIEAKIKDILVKRTEKQPQGFGSAGSFFENPVVKDRRLIEKFEKDCNIKCKDDKIPAGWLIAEAGLQGKKIGEIQVSEKHANFLVNLGGGKADDVIMLSSLIKQKVRDEFGVGLKEEVKYVGF